MSLPVIKSDFYTSIVLALITTILVWLNTPTPTNTDNNNSVFGYTMILLTRTFVISFLVIYALYYFTNTDSRGEDVIQNIIKTEPEF